MPLINYSPWMDAARYGQGLGETLGRILLQMPQIRAQQQISLAELPLRMQLQQSQLANEQGLLKYRQAEADALPVRAQADVMRAQTAQDALGLRQKTEEDRVTQQKASVSNFTKHLQEIIRHNKAVEAARTSTKTATPVAPEVTDIRNMNLLNLLSQQSKMIAPAHTNFFGQVSPAGMLRPKYESVLQQLQGGMAQPTAAPVGGRVRVIAPDGSPGTVSAASLQEALQSGYKLAQ